MIEGETPQRKKSTLKQKAQGISMLTALIGGLGGFIYCAQEGPSLPTGAEENLPNYNQLIEQYKDFDKLYLDAQEKIKDNKVREAIEIFNSKQFQEDAEARATIIDANKVDPHETARNAYLAGGLISIGFMAGSVGVPLGYRKFREYYPSEKQKKEMLYSQNPPDDETPQEELDED